MKRKVTIGVVVVLVVLIATVVTVEIMTEAPCFFYECDLSQLEIVGKVIQYTGRKGLRISDSSLFERDVVLGNLQDPVGGGYLTPLLPRRGFYLFRFSKSPSATELVIKCPTQLNVMPSQNNCTDSLEPKLVVS